MRGMARSWLPALAAILALSGIASCPARERAHPATPKKTVRLAIAFTSDLLGYLEPCGCVKGQLGGIARTAAVVDGLAKDHDGVIYVDAGDTLTDGRKVDAEREGQVRAKASTVATILSALHVVSVRGEDDTLLGDAFYEKAMGTHALVPLGATSGARVVERAGVEVGLVGVSAPGAAPAKVVALVKAARARIHGQPRLVIAILHVGLTSAMAAARSLSGVVDAVIVGHLDDPSQGDTDRAIDGLGVPVFRPMSQGRSLGVLEVRVPPGAPAGITLVRGRAAFGHDVKILDERIARMKRQRDAAQKAGSLDLVELLTSKIHDLSARRAAAASRGTVWPKGRAAMTWRFAPIAPGLRQAKWAVADIDAYDTQVEKLNLAYAKAHPTACPKPEKGQSGYVGNAACADCHESEMRFWKTMRHAHAWKTLVDAHKQYDLECVGCHVTGWQEPGGVCNLADVTRAVGDLSSPLLNVQCEACHGPGSRHVAADTDAEKKATIHTKVPASVCTTCHTGQHSPHFEYDTYRAKIVGPGHGMPLPKKVKTPTKKRKGAG